MTWTDRSCGEHNANIGHNWLLIQLARRCSIRSIGAIAIATIIIIIRDAPPAKPKPGTRPRPASLLLLLLLVVVPLLYIGFCA